MVTEVGLQARDLDDGSHREREEERAPWNMKPGGGEEEEEALVVRTAV